MKLQDHLVTVAVPVHNGTRWLGEALGSALAQTHEHLEILVFDDASSDGSADLARSLGDHRIEVMESPSNVGVGAARQELKTRARGDYIAWLDADDVFDSRRVEVLLGAATRNNADIVIDGSWFLDEGGSPRPGHKRVPDTVASDPHFTRLFERNVMNPHPLVSRRCFEAVDFDPELRVSEDYDFWLKASWQGFRFHRVDQMLHGYRLTPGSLSSDPEAPRRAVRRVYDRFPVSDLQDLYRQRGYGEAHVRYMTCLQHLFRGDYRAALAQTLAGWPGEDNADVDFYRGTLELKCGNDATGERHLRQHLDRQPESPAGWNNLGVWLNRSGRDAEPAWERAQAIFPRYQDPVANLDGTEALTLTQLPPRRHR